MLPVQSYQKHKGSRAIPISALPTQMIQLGAAGWEVHDITHLPLSVRLERCPSGTGTGVGLLVRCNAESAVLRLR